MIEAMPHANSKKAVPFQASSNFKLKNLAIPASTAWPSRLNLVMMPSCDAKAVAHTLWGRFS